MVEQEKPETYIVKLNCNDCKQEWEKELLKDLEWMLMDHNHTYLVKQGKPLPSPWTKTLYCPECTSRNIIIKDRII